VNWFGVKLGAAQRLGEGAIAPYKGDVDQGVRQIFGLKRPRDKPENEVGPMRAGNVKSWVLAILKGGDVLDMCIV